MKTIFGGITSLIVMRHGIWNGYTKISVTQPHGLISAKIFFEHFSLLKNKEDNEYWMTLNKFQCNFSGLINCSEADPYHPEGFELERSFKH